MLIRNIRRAVIFAVIAGSNSIHKLRGPGGTRPPDKGSIDRNHKGASTTIHGGSSIGLFDDERHYWESGEELGTGGILLFLYRTCSLTCLRPSAASANMSPNFDVLYSLFHCVDDATNTTPVSAQVSTSTVSSTHGSLYNPGSLSFGSGYPVCPAQATSATAHISSSNFFANLTNIDLSNKCPSRLAIVHPRAHPSVLSAIEPANYPSTLSTVELASAPLESAQGCHLDEAPVNWIGSLIHRFAYVLALLGNVWRDLRGMLFSLMIGGISELSGILAIRLFIALSQSNSRAEYNPGKVVQAMTLGIWQLYITSWQSIVYTVYSPGKAAQAMLHYFFKHKLVSLLLLSSSKASHSFHQRTSQDFFSLFFLRDLR